MVRQAHEPLVNFLFGRVSSDAMKVADAINHTFQLPAAFTHVLTGEVEPIAHRSLNNLVPVFCDPLPLHATSPCADL